MSKSVDLPIFEPVYSTYHCQGSCMVFWKDNPSIFNWYFNNSIIPYCNRKILYGYMTPELSVLNSSIIENPYIEKIRFPLQLIGGSMHNIIRSCIDNGYYVYFTEIDDYYIEGKSWYHERHSPHDGLICGYNQEDKTYSVYAYDNKWVYRVFKTPQKGFNKGRDYEIKAGACPAIYAVRALDDKIELNLQEIYLNLKNYLDSTLDKYPIYDNAVVIGTVIHDYIAYYLNRLADGSVPHNRMDRRIFRVIWEHKKLMYERISAVEKELLLTHELSDHYKSLVRIADDMRMQYASYVLKERRSLVLLIRDKLIRLKFTEIELLTELLSKMEEGVPELCNCGTI